LGRAVAYWVSSGIQSEISRGSFGQGFLSGGLSSGISSGIGELGGNSFDQILGGGLSGGIGSVISGGNFFDGFGQGVAVGAFNHALHNEAQGEWPPRDGDPGKVALAEMMASRQGGDPQDYYNALTNPDFVSDKINQNVGDLLNLEAFLLVEI